LTDARTATLEDLVGHPIDPDREYRISLPSEVHAALKAGYILQESFDGPDGEPFILLWRYPSARPN
jgi:hypothetical protein